MNDPALILADEPTGNLDTATGDAVLETFLDLRSAGKTIVLITHDAEVAAVADRTVHIRDGRLYEHGPEGATRPADRLEGPEGLGGTANPGGFDDPEGANDLAGFAERGGFADPSGPAGEDHDEGGAA